MKLRPKTLERSFAEKLPSMLEYHACNHESTVEISLEEDTICRLVRYEIRCSDCRFISCGIHIAL